jgi:dihydroorotase-like cyclic amidohydrolase
MSSTQSLLIRGAHIILPNGEFMVGDVLTRDRQIVEVAPEISGVTATREIDAQGLTLLPGVIDPQVHFREPGLEHKEDLFTASCACAKGGVTSFLEMPNTRPLTNTQAALDDKLQRAANKCTVPQVVNWMSSAVAKAYGIPNKGAIAPGYDADLVLVDLNTYLPVRREELLTKCGWSPFEGWNLTGWAVTTIVGGEIVYENGKVNTEVRGQALTLV